MQNSRFVFGHESLSTILLCSILLSVLDPALRSQSDNAVVRTRMKKQHVGAVFSRVCPGLDSNQHALAGVTTSR